MYRFFAEIFSRLYQPVLSLIAGFVLLLSAGFMTVVHADSRSIYSDLDLRKCPVVEEASGGEGEWTVMRCRGISIGGGPSFTSVFVSEADLRFSLGYGPNGRVQKSFGQFLSPFNTIGRKMEWRIVNGEVVATILRYYTDDGTGGKKGQILVVTRISPDGNEACHVAYIDARLNRNANQMARNVAETIAPGFNCEKDEPTHVGLKGRD